MSESSSIPISQACQLLGMSWNRVWNLVLTGKIAGQKIDGRWMVNVEDVERLRERRRASETGRIAAAV